MSLRACVIGAICLALASPAAADPVLLFLFRMLRDQVIAMSIEKGITALREQPTPQAPRFGYALPTPAVTNGAEEQRVRELIDESFLHLTAAQRDAVFASVQQILRDPQHAQNKPQIVADFTLKARTVRDSYRVLDRLTLAEKKTLAQQAKEQFMRLSAAERGQMLEVLRSGMLPMPRDLAAIILAEMGALVARDLH